MQRALTFLESTVDLRGPLIERSISYFAGRNRKRDINPDGCKILSCNILCSIFRHWSELTKDRTVVVNFRKEKIHICKVRLYSASRSRSIVDRKDGEEWWCGRVEIWVCNHGNQKVEVVEKLSFWLLHSSLQKRQVQKDNDRRTIAG